jgi:hypothetical protein
LKEDAMAKVLSRVSMGVVSLFILAGLGCATGQNSRDLHFHTAYGIHVVIVGPRASDLSIDKLYLDSGRNEVAFWVHKLKGKNLFIEFDEEVFQNMTKQSNGHWRLNDCQKRRCYSDEIKLYYPHDPVKNQHIYYQIVEDATSREVKDGIIIITP